MANDTGTQSTFASLMSSALTFATPFAQKLLGQSTTPAAMTKETLTNAALNGSGPNDPTLAMQSPTGLWDFITGGKVTGSNTGKSGGGGLSSGPSLTFIGVILIAVIAVFVMLKK